MSARQRLEKRLREAGIPLDSLSSIPGIAPTVVLTVGYTSSGDIAVTHIPPCDTAVCFEGLYYPLPGVTLLVEQSVADELELTARPNEDNREPDFKPAGSIVAHVKRSRCFLLLIAALLFVSAGVVAGAILLDRTLRPPAEWLQVTCGMPRSEVHRLCPNPHTELVSEKGDFWYADRPLGWWRMQISYDEQQRLRSKSVSLHLGTYQTFRHYPFL